MPRLRKPAINSIIFELENGEIESGCSSTDEDRLQKADGESIKLNEESSNSMKHLSNGLQTSDNADIPDISPAIPPSMDGESSQSNNSAIKFENRDLRTPTITIKFKDKRTAKAYKLKIKKYIRNLIKKSYLESSASVAYDTDSDTELNFWSSDDDKSFHAEDTVTDGFDSVLVSSNSRPAAIKDDSKRNEINCESDIFICDTKPATSNDHAMPPYYRKKFDTLDNSSNEKPANAQPTMSRGSKCFNCNGGHSLRDCPEPKNYQRINQNRKAMMNRPGRYHVEEQNKSAGNDDSVVAGRISGALRQALGLHKNQLPVHIYRMRMLGYPPGWLMHAKITHSGIAIFDSEGKEVADPEDEDGELVQEGSKDKYDCKKILDFPGFNVPASSRYTDESEFYGCPPLSENDSKLIMLESLAPKMAKAYRRKKLIHLQQSATEQLPGDMNVHTDMDLDDQAGEETEVETGGANGFEDGVSFVPPLPALPVPSPPPPPPPTLLPGEEPTCPRISPSLDDLETRKMLLLAALDDGSHDSSAKISPQSPITVSDVKEAPDTPQSKIEPEVVAPTTPRVGEVRDSSLGTPMMSSMTPYHKLPTDVSFSKDICDVINFENLPDSTGKYLQMSGIIKKVRNAVAKIQED